MRSELTEPLWMTFWPENAARTISYPEIPVFAILSNAARTFGEKVADRTGFTKSYLSTVVSILTSLF